jgi:hypothetical protein
MYDISRLRYDLLNISNYLRTTWFNNQTFYMIFALHSIFCTDLRTKSVGRHRIVQEVKVYKVLSVWVSVRTYGEGIQSSIYFPYR